MTKKALSDKNMEDLEDSWRIGKRVTAPLSL